MPARHLYVHVPFCTRRCSYCDFAIAVRPSVPVDDYLRGLAKEISQRAPNRAPLETVYLGGGTPSRLGATGISRALDLVRENFALDHAAEITIEANPEDISVDSATAWRNAGVNRLSVGIQSFDDAVLRWMHRVHDASRARQAIDDARSAGIENISVDLIFALPRHLGRSWEKDLETALGLAPSHISLYGLTIEKATPLARWTERGQVIPADEELYAAEFLLADRLATSAGYRHYEVSNFALPGRESRHNSAYWSGAGYIGLGPSAHSYDGVTRTWNVPAYAGWMENLDSGEPALSDSEILTKKNRAAESVYLGLRTSSGYRAGESDLRSAARWVSEGWARIEDSVIKLTPEGWLRLDSLAAGLTGF